MVAAHVKFVLSNAWFCHLFQILISEEEHWRAEDKDKEEEEEGEVVTAEEEDEMDEVDEVGRG